MRRIDGDGAIPNHNGPGKNGFSDEYPNRTIVTDDWTNDVQEEIANVIEGAGLTLGADRDQLDTAIRSLVAPKISGPSSATDNHVARWDGATGRLLQDGSPVAISDAGAMTGVTSLAMGGALSGVTDITLSGEANYASAKSRTRSIGSRAFAPGSEGSGWTWNPNGFWQIPTATATSSDTNLYADLTALLKPGMTISTLDVKVGMGASRATVVERMHATLYRTLTSGTGTPTAVVSTEYAPSSGASAQTITITANHVVVEGYSYHLAVGKGSNTAGADDIVRHGELHLLDPGPRS